MIKEVYDDIINLTLSIKSSIKKERNLLINNNLSINIVASNVQKIITEFKQYLEEYSCLKNNPIIDILNKYNDDLLHIINEDNKDNVLIILDNITDSLLDKVQENIIVKDDILSLTLIVKNEAFYIKEWIEFHRMIGVTHFYIYDNESSDDLYKKLSSYISQGIVTYTYWPTKGVYSTRLEAQLAAYNDSLYKYKYDTKYMGFIDVDEFIVPVNRKNIIEVIDDIFYRYENCGGIGINWRVYGSSYNEKKIDGLVVENYKYRAYDNYDFADANQQILNYFTNVLSSFYMDFTKDILYIEKADSLRRRQVQTVLYYHAKAMMKLISPVLVFTAEELHDHFHCDENKAESIFLEPNVEKVVIENSDEIKSYLFFSIGKVLISLCIRFSSGQLFLHISKHLVE